jgi:hypothetical protein
LVGLVLFVLVERAEKLFEEEGDGGEGVCLGDGGLDVWVVVNVYAFQEGLGGGKVFGVGEGLDGWLGHGFDLLWVGKDAWEY